MQLDFFVKMKSFSVNHSHMTTRTGMRIATKEFREWREEFGRQLRVSHLHEIEQARKYFKREKHFLNMSFIFVSTDMLKKDGLISLKSLDLDNVTKHPTDVLFKLIGGEIDDALVTYKQERKCQGTENATFISLEIVEYQKNQILH